MCLDAPGRLRAVRQLMRRRDRAEASEARAAEPIAVYHRRGAAPLLGMRALLFLPVVLLVLAVASSPAQAQKQDQGGSVVGLSSVSSPVIDVHLDELWWRLGPFVADPQDAERLQGLMSCVGDRVRGRGAATSPSLVKASIAEALNACARALGMELPSRGLDQFFGLGGIGGRGGGAVSYACSATSTDPRWASYNTRKPEDWEREAYGLDETQSMYTDQEMQRRMAEYELNKPELELDVIDAYWDAQQTKEYKAWKAADVEAQKAPLGSKERLDAYWKADKLHQEYLATPERMKADEADRAAKPPAPFTRPLHSMIDPNAPDPCAAAAQLAADIRQCAASEWLGGFCTMLDAQLRHCSDPQITDPAPDQDGCRPESGSREATRAELEAAALSACESLVHYGPDGQSPCAPYVGTGAPVIDRNSRLYIYTCLLMGVCTAQELACSSPITMPNPNSENCSGHATLLSIGPDLDEIIAEGIERLGGPGWTPPASGSWPSGPRPGP